VVRRRAGQPQVAGQHRGLHRPRVLCQRLEQGERGPGGWNAAGSNRRSRQQRLRPGCPEQRRSPRVRC
jgi:hypothetical protein